MVTTAPVTKDWQRFTLPVVVGAVQLVGSFGAADGQPDRRAMDALAVLLLLAGPAALAFLRHRPVVMATAVMAVTDIYIVTGYPYGPVFLSLGFALYLVIGAGHRRAGWIIAAAGLASAVTLQALVGRGPAWSFWHTVGAAGWLLAMVVVADVARVKSEQLADARRARAEEARRRVSEERLRIAQELHDVLAHNISLINVQAGVGLHLMNEQPDRARDALVAIKQASKDALGELRSVLDLLRGEGEAAPRSPTAGLAELDRLVANAAAAGLDVEVRREGAPRPLPPEVDLAALRIAQEALTNVARHAHASRACVRICFEPDELVVEVDDNGRGPAGNGAGTATGGGNGITGMRERAAALGGRLDAGPGPAGGFRVAARLPLGTPS
jgi:signal transduction histidine kinase